MRLLSIFAMLVPLAGCLGEDEGEDLDLGSIPDGKSDAPEIKDQAVTIPKKSSSGAPGVRNVTVTSTVDFDVSLHYDAAAEVKIVVTNLDTGEAVESDKTHQPSLAVSAAQGSHGYKIRLENYASSTLHAKLSALGHGGTVSPALLAAARANLDRITKEVDWSHLSNYGLSGATTDQFLTALSAEYEKQ